MRKRSVINIGIIGLLILAGYLFVCWYFPSGEFSYANYLRIQAGTTLKDVEGLLGSAGEEVQKSEVPHIVDWSEPENSPRRLKPVIHGEKFYQWREQNDNPLPIGPYIVVGFVNGKVKEKYGWWPAP